MNRSTMRSRRIAPPAVHDVLRAPGRPLDAATRSFFEPRFGHDFSRVRVHDDARAAASARDIHARAWTAGPHVILGTPHSSRDVLAHELAHTIQQRDASSDGPIAIGATSDPAERRADAAARAALTGAPPPRVSPEPLALRRKPLPGIDPFDPVHSGFIAQDRERERVGPDEGPSDADIKYRDALRDPEAQAVPPGQSRDRQLVRPADFRIAPLPDLLLDDLKSPRLIHLEATATLGAHPLVWTLFDPRDMALVRETHTPKPRSPHGTFALIREKLGALQPGLHHLQCTALDQHGGVVATASRDFRLLAQATPQREQRAHGTLSFRLYKVLTREEAAKAGSEYAIFASVAFLPSPSVQCGDIAMIQAVQNLTPSGQPFEKDQVIAQRNTEAGWHIDKRSGNLSPYLIAQTDPKTGKTQDDPGSGEVGRGGPDPKRAVGSDMPGGGTGGGTKRFETCAVCRSGSSMGQVYGCATWGYTAEETNPNAPDPYDRWKVALHPHTFADHPTRKFIDAAKAWNVWASAGPGRVSVPELKTP